MSAVGSDPGEYRSFLDVKHSNFRFDPFEQRAVTIGRNALIRGFMHVHSLRQDAIQTQIYRLAYSVKWGPTQVRL
jgi:hypothetical protein